MGELTLEQKRAMAMAKARLRLQEQGDPEYGGPIEEAVGLGEAVLSNLPAVVATPIAGLAGIGATALEGGRTGPEAVESVMRFAERFRYEPRTEIGQRTLEAFGRIGEAVEGFADTAGEVSGDPEDTLGATAVKTAILGATAALGLRGRPPVRAKAPTTEALREAAQASYAAAEKGGVIISNGSFRKAVSDIQNTLANEGVDASLHPRALAAFNRLKESADTGNAVSLKGAEILRRVIKGAEKSLEPDERRMAGIMRDEFDDYIESLGPNDVLAGDAQAATQALKEARSLWSRMRKGETMDELVERAENRASQMTSSGMENALRTEFRILAQNKKRMRGFSKEEQKAIKRVARGDTVGNALRMLGKLAPTGPVSAAISGGAGAVIGGPAGAIALPLAGGIARVGATAMTKRNALAASELMRRGGAAPRTAVPPNALSVAIGAQLPQIEE